MEIGQKVQYIKNKISGFDTFRMYKKGAIMDREHGTRGGITGNWYLVKFENFPVPYWCHEDELKVIK